MILKKDSYCNSQPCDCCLLDRSCSKVVVSRGNPFARLMIIGEAPGASEDETGEPFVGRSGKILDQLLEAVDLNGSKDAFICNVIKCRPPNNRRPTKSELLSNLPWLYQQIKLVDPLVIVLAGSTPVQAILGIKGGITRLRGQWQFCEGRAIMPIFHPSYLVRNPSKEEGSPFSLTIGDFEEVRNRLNTYDLTSIMPTMASDNTNKS